MEHHKNLYGITLLLFLLFVALSVSHETSITGNAIADRSFIQGETLLSACNDPLGLGTNFAFEILVPYYGCDADYLCQQALEIETLPGDVTVSFHCNQRQQSQFIASCLDSLHTACS